ncbi:MAG: hypothetical protein L3J56_02880 [Bacteroidales bacterium]|nr:hypothetical protein [Bacteroidales bacterium]
MKKIIYTLSFLIIAINIFAQAPQSFKYQAVIRNSSGDIIANQNVGIQISILEGSSTGTSSYIETWNLNTNQFGLINLNVGKGTSTDNFTSIDWGNKSYWLKIAVDETGGTNYTEMGASQLLSVPYAIYANQSANGTSQWLNNNSTIYYNGGNVGVGTTTPSGKLVIQADDGAGPDSALFEVKDKFGMPIFRVTSEGVRIYVKDTNKGVSGGFAVGRYATAKSFPDTSYLIVTPDSTRIYTSGGAKGVSGGFAVGRYALAKSAPNTYFYTGIDSTRIYIRESAKGTSGGFAVGRYALAKASSNQDYFNINASNIPDTINPSEARIVWYPLKEAFLTGRVLIESADSVGLNSMATGYESKAIGDYSQAMGYKTVSNGLNSMAIGYKSRANGINSYAFGKEVLANDTNSFVFGNKSAALGKGTFAFGAQDTAIGNGSMALGFQTTAKGVASMTMGAFTKAMDTLDVAMGYNTVASGGGSTAMGWYSQSKGGASLAMGDSTVAGGEASLAMGSHTLASGQSSTAMGIATIASGENSTAMGDSTIASGFASTAMGYQTEAHGFNTIAMGDNTVAWGDASVAMGSNTHANGLFSLAIGNQSVADNDASVAIGDQTTANGLASWSAGTHTVADGDASTAFGFYTHAVAGGSFVLGGFNEIFSADNAYDPFSALFVIGNGTDEASRHNAFTVLKSGFVGIGTNTPSDLFTVNGNGRFLGDLSYVGNLINAKKSKLNSVFDSNYKKYSISEVDDFIKKNKHLPWISSSVFEKGGINMTELSFKTLETLENQQLQIIDLNKQLQEKGNTIKELESKIDEMNKQIKIIKKYMETK